MSEAVKRDPLMYVIVAFMGLMSFAMFQQRNAPTPVPGPAPVPVLAQQLSGVLVGEHAKQDACQFGCYFDCLATLAQGGELTQKSQVENLIGLVGRAGKQFAKGTYPGLREILAGEMATWSKEAGEITPADRAALVAKFQYIAQAFHALSE